MASAMSEVTNSFVQSVPAEKDDIPALCQSESLYGYYPPAHGQFDPVPYKTMAVLGDYAKFKPINDNQEDQHPNHDQTQKYEPIPPTDESESVTTTKEASTVLNSKLNSIREQLSRSRIDVRKIRRNFVPGPNAGVKTFMNVPENWDPRYPEPSNLSLLSETKKTQKSQVSESRPVTSGTIKQQAEVRVDDKTPCKFTGVPLQIKEQTFIQVEEPRSNNTSERRPYTAPGFIGHRQPRSKTKQGQLVRSGTQIRRPQSQEPPARKIQNDLSHYKWLMEVHGDPFNLKQPHLPEKRPLFQRISLSAAKILPQPPPMQRQSRDTFFQSTSLSMPNGRNTFEISPQFVSERYNAIKDQMRSKGQWNYAYKSFSFVY